jgi:hypothetical protein
MTDNNVELVETTPEMSTTTQTIANIAVLSFAVIGAVQTTRFAVAKVQSGIRIVKTARALKAASENAPTES